MMRPAPLLAAMTALMLALSVPARADWTASGVFQYQDRPFTSAGFTGAHINLPIRFAVVQVIDQNTQTVVASGGTDSTGHFSIHVTDSQTRNLYVRVVSYAADSLHYHLQVRAGIGAGLFASAGPNVPAHAPSADLNFNGGSPMIALAFGVGESFNILDCLENGVDFVASINAGQRPPGILTALWNATSIDGTYFAHGSSGSSSNIHLTGEDGYNDTVINHEEGHFMAWTFSLDSSPGGQHFIGDNNQDMRLAWSEGWATYFGQSVRRHFGFSDPTYYVDMLGESGSGASLNFSYEIETPSASAVGGASEVSVQAALWDLVDNASTPDVHPGVDDDSLSFPETNTLDVLKSYLPTAPPVTIETFWDGWFARGFGHQAGMISTFGLEKMEFFPDAFENDNFAARAVLVVPGDPAAHHTFYPNGGGADVDWSKFQATAGHSYIIETAHVVGGADTRIQVVAATDTTSTLASNDNRAAGDLTSRVDFTAPATGTYLARCSSVAGYSRYGSYDFRITEGTPSSASFADVTGSTANGQNGRGVAWGDFNNDGYPDLYVCNTGADAGTGAPDRLYQNNGGSSFTDVASAKNVVAGSEQHEAAAWGDFDNDGYLDLAVTSVEGVHLFRNGGPPSFSFAEVTSSAGLTPGVSARTVNWVDYDRDGYLDLYFTNYGGPNRLWRNNHNGTFTAVVAGVEFSGHTFSSAWTDYDHDGLQDLALGLDGDVDGAGLKLFHQKNDHTFEDVTTSAGLGGGGRIFGLAWGDYDGDGYQDLFVANESGINRLYHNNGDGSFTERGNAANIQGGLGSTSIAWLDMDNDGDLDAYAVNFSGPSNMFDNLNGHSFTSSGIAPVSGQSRAVAAADFNRDGWMDLYVSSQGSNTLWQAMPVGGGRFLELHLRGRTSNRTAIGARAMVAVGGRQVWREVNGGQAWGSQPMQTMHFGLGPATVADTVVVLWPSGRVTRVLHPATNQFLNVDEDSGFVDSIGVKPPSQVVLRQSYPNPMRSEAIISFDIPTGAVTRHVRIAIYDIQGRLEKVLLDARMVPAFDQRVCWDGTGLGGRPVGPGVHFYRLDLDGTVLTRKLVLAR